MHKIVDTAGGTRECREAILFLLNAYIFLKRYFSVPFDDSLKTPIF